MRLTHRLAIAIIFLAGFGIYFFSLSNGFIIGDDEDQIVNHELVHSLRHLPRLFMGSTYYQPGNETSYGPFYRPLMLSVFALIYSVSGPDPFLFHLVQVGLHSLNAVLVYWLFYRFFKRRYLAFFGSLLFLVHPINAEAVLHIANMQETLVLAAGLGVLLTIQKQIQPIRLVIFLILALLAKESAVIVFTLGLFYCLGFNRSRLKMYLIYSMVSVSAYAVIRFGLAQVFWHEASVPFLLNSLPFTTRLLSVPKVLWSYLETFFWPKTLAVHQTWVVMQPTVLDFWAPLIALGLFVLGSIWFKNQICNPKQKKIFHFFLIWLGLGLLLHSQIIALYVTVSDRWFYVTSVGLIGLLVSIIANTKIFFRFPLILSIGALILFVALSGRTVTRSFNWVDSKTLLEHDLGLKPVDYYLKNLLATTYIREELYEKAAPLITASVNEHAFIGNTSNQAIVALNQGDLDQANTSFLASFQYGTTYAQAVNYSNFLYYVQQDLEAARATASAMLTQYPKGGDLWLIVAQVDYLQGNYDNAVLAADNAVLYAPIPLSHAVYAAIREQKPLLIDSYIKGP